MEPNNQPSMASAFWLSLWGSPIPSNSSVPANTKKHGIHEYLPIKIKRHKIAMLLEQAKRILDNWKGQDVRTFTRLANLQTETGIYLDAINYLLNHGFEGKITCMQIETEVNALLPQLEDLVLKLSPQNTEISTQNTENHGDQNNETPGGNARRFLQFLSSFPEGFIFNSNRVTRFASVKEFASGTDGDQRQLLEQLYSPPLEVIVRISGDGNKVIDRISGDGNEVIDRISGDGNEVIVRISGDGNEVIDRISGDGNEVIVRISGDGNEVIDRISGDGNEVIGRISRDGNEVPYHFRISNNAVEKSRNWPEKISFWPRYSLADNAESRVLDHKSFFHSLVFLGCRGLNLEEHDFLSLRVLSLRNVKITNTKHLEKLVLLQYLDLKHAKLELKMENCDCDWLKALEELVVLDLRYTNVEEIPDECLQKLGKLQHLLLGYIPKEESHGLAGVKMNIEKMKTKNLKTLRAVRNGNLDVIASTVVDLSVTDLTEKELSEFWSKAETLENLTSLGVAVTKDTAITLKDFPKRLKDNLKRLRIDGYEFSEHDNLEHFEHLIDLTLISPRSSSGCAENCSNIKLIPTLEKLICLRLYGFHDQSLTFEDIKFKNIKKLVIGDMAKLKTVQIDSNQFETLDTLKFYTSSSSKTGSLALTLLPNESSPKNIYLRNTKIALTSSVTNPVIYSYDMNNQCYKQDDNYTTRPNRA